MPFPSPQSPTRKRFVLLSMLFCAALLVFPSVSVTEETPAPGEPADCWWPQFHGPRRDNKSDETGLLKQWPEEGPPRIWTARGIGHGYATVSIAEGCIYTAGNVDDQTAITAMDMDGRILWQIKTAPAFDQSFPGSRATPTFDRGKLYHLNGNGFLACLDAESGNILWQMNILERFGGRRTTWGISEAVLVDGDRVICTPGGPEVGMVALDKETGKTIWTCDTGDDLPGYTAPILIDYGGLRQIATMMSASAVGVSADDGRLLWRFEHRVEYNVNVCTPVYRDGRVALFGTWGKGATQLKLNVTGRDCSVTELWHTEELDNEHGGVVLAGGYLFGQADGNHRSRHWACLEWETGRTMYSVEGIRTQRSGTLTFADGMLYLLGDKGDVALMPAVPERFEPVSRFKLPDEGEGPYWAHPVVCGGRLYLRHDDFLYVYDIRSIER